MVSPRTMRRPSTRIAAEATAYEKIRACGLQPYGALAALAAMKHPLPFALVFAFLLLPGCAPTLAPHTPYLPMLRAKGEAEARILSGPLGKEVELQLGYQATDRLVIHTALLRHKHPNYGTYYRSADLGLGYYRPLGDGRWRLGLHAGGAYGSGASGSAFCPDLCDDDSSFDVRYAYGYLQPTIILHQSNVTFGFGLRLARAYYFRMEETQVDLAAPDPQIQVIDRAGHQFTFMQPTFQLSFRIRPWLAFSSSLGIQASLSSRNFLDSINPLIGQIGLHIVLPQKPTP